MAKIEINEQIRAKARAIIKERDDEKQYIATCVNANICPTCGEPLKEEWDGNTRYQFCTVDKKHYKEVTGFDDDGD